MNNISNALDAHTVACKAIKEMGKLLLQDEIGELTITVGKESASIDLFFVDSCGTLAEALKEMFALHKAEIYLPEDKVAVGEYTDVYDDVSVDENSRIMCAGCDTDLEKCKTVWQAEGCVYCSRECGVYDFGTEYGTAAVDKFDAVAKEIKVEDFDFDSLLK